MQTAMTSPRASSLIVGVLVMLCVCVTLQTVYADDVLNDDKWHSVVVRRRQKRLLLEVDDGKTMKGKARSF